MALTLKRVEAAKRPGRHIDAHGLYLQVTDGGAKSWLFRWERTIAGKRCDRWMGLGPLHTIGLEEARESARQCRLLLLQGLDPAQQRAERIAKAAKRTTFEEAARAWHAKQEPTYKSAKHAKQILTSLETYAFPILGAVDVAAVDTDLIVKALSAHWERVPETMSRLRGRLEAVLDWATVAGMRMGDNPARWSGHLSHLLAAPQKLKHGRCAHGGAHHAALPFRELPAFWTALSERQGTAADALRFLILTAARSGEVLGATWSEIDLANRVWTIPASRMKARTEHRVPLTAAALAILESLPRETGNPHVFISPTVNGKGLSGMSLLKLLQERMGRAELTVHGFRSAFSDWAHETTGFPNHVIELSLAHSVGSAVEKAYRRGDMFAKRRKLLEAWTAYCTSPKPAANVTDLAAHKAAKVAA
jgi:integrase